VVERRLRQDRRGPLVRSDIHKARRTFVSDPVRYPMPHPLSDAARDTFRKRIAEHVTAIAAALRDLQAEAVPDREQAPYQAGAAAPVVMNVQVALPGHGATVLHIPHPGATCPDDTVPIFFTYVGGHFATGEPYYVMDVFCA
jgi:hypothetical protein